MEVNFTTIVITEGISLCHFYFPAERCIFVNYSKRGAIKSLSCLDVTCNCKAKIINGQLIRTNRVAHSHAYDHESFANYEIAYENLRNAFRTQRHPIRELHDEAIDQVSQEIADAFMGSSPSNS